jgi:hypothetical protein
MGHRPSWYDHSAVWYTWHSPANGLLPQAPLHSKSLMHTEKEEQIITVDGEEKREVREVWRVYEQRWSAFLHAAGILVFVSPPFMHVLALTPTSVLAGLFLFMGEQSLSVNPILYRHSTFLRRHRSYLPYHLRSQSPTRLPGELMHQSTVTRLCKL